ncbi:hypothetical protein [Nocardioides pakistanensis]
MATISQCPACGEDERLRGRTSGDDIEVTCEACGAQWLRGATRCNSCARADVVVRPQVMTRQPRGNQLAIVGRRDLPLCPVCDADAIAESLGGNRPVPETYVSVFLFGRDVPRHLPRKPAPAAGTNSVDNAPAEGGTRAPLAASTTPTPKAEKKPPARRPGPARPEPLPAKEQRLNRPTARQAIEAYLSAHPEADSLAMLLLGQHLGPASRLETLDGPGTADSLRRWFDATWDARQDERRRTAAAAITRAMEYWRAQGWLTEDPAAGLR